MRSRNLLLSLLLVLIIGAAGALAYMLLRPQPAPSTNSQTPGTAAESEDTGITLEEVAKHTGRDGNSCWVAVDDTVYEISGFVQWADGVHSPSGGRARCGKDLSEVINESPHGKSKLKYLKEVGPFKR